jgi:hypothetical protein
MSQYPFPNDPIPVLLSKIASNTADIDTSTGSGAYVTSIVAGTGISISPTSGVGTVTITATTNGGNVTGPATQTTNAIATYSSTLHTLLNTSWLISSNTLTTPFGATVVDNGSGGLALAAGGTNGAGFALGQTANGFATITANTTSTAGQPIAEFLAPSKPTSTLGAGPYVQYGIAPTTLNSGFLQFGYVGAGSTGNMFGLGMSGSVPSLWVTGLNNVLIGTTTDFGSGSGQLKVNSNIVTNQGQITANVNGLSGGGAIIVNGGVTTNNACFQSSDGTTTWATGITSASAGVSDGGYRIYQGGVGTALTVAKATNAVAVTNATATTSVTGGAFNVNSVFAVNGTTGSLYSSGLGSFGTSMQVGTTLGVGVAPNNFAMLNIAGTIVTGSGNQYGLSMTGTFGSSVSTNTVYGINVAPTLTAGSYTPAAVIGLNIGTATIGSGATPTNLYGLYVANQTGGGTNYAIYTNGTAPSVFGGAITSAAHTITAGNTLTITGGSNALSGTVTLVAGAATITSTAITTNCVIMFSEVTSGGTPGLYQPLAKVSAGSAAVTSVSTDTSTYNWVAVLRA